MADIRKFLVQVEMQVEVELDAEKFDVSFMEEFQAHFYPFIDLIDHAEHIGQLAAREMLDEDFTEGYGPLADMGIKARVLFVENLAREETPA